MKINNVNQTSFKGLYTLRGKSDLLDDICSYYGRVQHRTRNTGEEFNFLSIRSPFSLNPSSDNHKVIPAGNSFFDLFITSKDEKLAKPHMRDIVADSLAIKNQKNPFDKHFKMLLKNLNELEERIRTGKPLLDINPWVLKNHLTGIFDFSSLRELEAEEAYQLLKKDRFDISNGAIGGFCN